MQTSNFQAEYGRSSGATIIGHHAQRHEGLSRQRRVLQARRQAGTATSSRAASSAACGVTAQCDPPLYTFDNAAWTLGGPVLIPGTDFNKGRNKLFFFWSQDILQRTDPGGLNQRRMPTALERSGDFSQTFDGQEPADLHPRPAARAAPATASTGGPACFADNIIPADRINPTARRC